MPTSNLLPEPYIMERALPLAIIAASEKRQMATCYTRTTASPFSSISRTFQPRCRTFSSSFEAEPVFGAITLFDFKRGWRVGDQTVLLQQRRKDFLYRGDGRVFEHKWVGLEAELEDARYEARLEGGMKVACMKLAERKNSASSRRNQIR